MPVELRVELHGTDRRTLLQRRTGERDWNEIAEAGLISNPDPCDFYRRTAAYMANMTAKGIKIIYTDAAR
jgi:hypothetical protein